MTIREPLSLFAQLPLAGGLERTLETTIDGLAKANQQAKANIDAVVESLGEATKGMEAMGANSIELSKKQWENGVAHVGKVATARNFQELVEIQSSWVHANLQLYMNNLQSVGEIATASMSRASEPLRIRMSASVDSGLPAGADKDT